MTQRGPTLVVVVLVVASAVVVPVAAAVAGTTQETPDPDENSSRPAENRTAPGEKLSGVVSVQGAELDGELRERTFGARIANASSDGAKAEVVADQVADVQRRVDELQQRKQRLQQARENGSISEGTYRAEIAELAAEAEHVRRMANHTDRVADELPGDLVREKLRDRGIDGDAIRTLRNRAATLGGPEVAEIAREVAGDDVGKPIADTGRPEDLPGLANRSGGPGGDRPGGSDDRPGGDDQRPGDDGTGGNGTTGTATDAVDRPQPPAELAA